MLRIPVLLGLFGLAEANTYYQNEAWVKSQPQRPSVDHRPNTSEPLYVHMIAHTHDDVGWLKTPDEYFTGSNQQSQHAEVHLILTTVLDELKKNPSRKFTYVEMKFFTMWWDRQSEETKADLRKLVAEGRFEFVNAGWSMHDEACPHYEDMLNNMAYGHEFLKKEFDYVPRVGWHIDPFGHSNANPRLFADMGFDSWFFARLDFQDKNERLENREMQTLWRPFA
jgi:alpha-mannosidase